MTGPVYDVYAVKYATRHQHSRDHFLSEDPHDRPETIDYFVWAIRGPEHTIVVDTGFNQARADTRGRTLIRCPTEGLRAVGIDAAAVDTVVVTHLHYDHAGNLDKFPNARFVLQDKEMAWATGRAMGWRMLRFPFEVEDVADMVRLNYSERVVFVDGTAEIAPGVHVHLVPGHSMGLQAVTVDTARGRLCLASDTLHFYANAEHAIPFKVVADIAGLLEGHRTIVRLADGPDHVIAGHDPLVTEVFPEHPDDALSFIVSAPPSAPIPIPPHPLGPLARP